jgi:hypothetical protein
MWYVLAIISQMKHRRKMIKYVLSIMLLHAIHIQLKSRLHKYYKIRIRLEILHGKYFLRNVTKMMFKSYGIGTVKIRNSKLVFADGVRVLLCIIQPWGCFIFVCSMIISLNWRNVHDVTIPWFSCYLVTRPCKILWVNVHMCCKALALELHRKWKRFIDYCHF